MVRGQRGPALLRIRTLGHFIVQLGDPRCNARARSRRDSRRFQVRFWWLPSRGIHLGVSFITLPLDWPSAPQLPQYTLVASTAIGQGLSGPVANVTTVPPFLDTFFTVLDKSVK